MQKVNCSLCDATVEGRTLASPQKLENRLLEMPFMLSSLFVLAAPYTLYVCA